MPCICLLHTKLCIGDHLTRLHLLIPLIRILGGMDLPPHCHVYLTPYLTCCSSHCTLLMLDPAPQHHQCQFPVCGLRGSHEPCCFMMLPCLWIWIQATGPATSLHEAAVMVHITSFRHCETQMDCMQNLMKTCKDVKWTTLIGWAVFLPHNHTLWH